MNSSADRYYSGEKMLLYDVDKRPGGRSIEEVEGVVYGHSDNGRPLHLDILRPTDKGDQARLAIVWIHGGGWGGRGVVDTYKQGTYVNYPFALEGYFTVTIEYTLSARAPFPAQIHDCKASIRWLRAHSERYHIDPDRIAVWGRSAGGHLCSLLGTSAEVAELEGEGGWEVQSSRVNAVIDYFGPTDLNTIAGPQNGPKAAHIRHVVGTFLGGSIEENRSVAAVASPIRYITPEAPPFLIIHGEDDLPVRFSQGQSLHEALRKNEVQSNLVRVRNVGHGLLPSKTGVGIEPSLSELYGIIREFLRTRFGEPEGGSSVTLPDSAEI